jgi:hypothetical protein
VLAGNLGATIRDAGVTSVTKTDDKLKRAAEGSTN